MYAEIYAVTGDRTDSSGKRTWVNTDTFSLAIGGPPAEHLGNPEKYLELTAKTSHWIGTGERGGFERTIEREFQLQLLEEDLRKIMDFALAHGLVGSEIKKNIRLVHEQLSDIAFAMKVRPTRRSTQTRRKRRARKVVR